MNEQQKDLLKELQQIEDTIKSLENLRSKVKADIVAVCTHGNKKTLETYVDGDYYNKAYTEYETRCVDCGKVLSTSTKTHNYY